MLKKYFILLVILTITKISFAQKNITIEDIFKKNKFKTEYFPGLKWLQDGQHYTNIIETKDSAFAIIKYNVITNKAVDTLLHTKHNKINFTIENYTFSDDESKIILETASERIYRRSAVHHVFVYDLNKKINSPIANHLKIAHATFSPDSKKIAYTRENNFYYTNLDTYEEYKITTDGKIENKINGSTDWVYEEEFEFAKAFFWSPNSAEIAYYSFDESEVKMYNLQKWGGLYPQDYEYKYPKAGEKNSIVQIFNFNLEERKITQLTQGTENEYTPRIAWTSNNDSLAIMFMNRHQNEMEIRHYHIRTSKFNIAYKEISNTYIEVPEIEHYLANNKGFFITSEKDGFRHIYLVAKNRKQGKQITKGNYEVEEILSIDEAKKKIYYISNQEKSTEKHFYVINFDGKGLKKLSIESGCHDIEISPNNQFYISTFSSFTTPPKVRLYNLKTNEIIDTLEENTHLVNTLKEHKINPFLFHEFSSPSKFSLNSWMIFPANFDSTKKYPVINYVYGGPGHQNVLNHWMGSYFLWFQLLANEGYIVMSVDNRGTGGKGADFKKCTYKKLGLIESEDQILVANYLKTLKLIDANRIGIWGWSFGGYLSTLSTLRSNGLYKATIAVAPVSDWRFYDNIYTERYMQTPEENPEGYHNTATPTYAKDLKNNYLLVHGTGDDNVHVQHSIALQDALIKEGKQFNTFYYPNRTHGISGGNTRYHLFKMMTEFWLKNL